MIAQIAVFSHKTERKIFVPQKLHKGFANGNPIFEFVRANIFYIGLKFHIV